MRTASIGSICSGFSASDDQFKTVEVNIKVKSYAQQIFKYIRWVDGITDSDIIKSLDPKNNRYQIFKTNQGQKHQEGGKSGSFFFFT